MPAILLNRWIQGAIALLILAFLLDWYTDGKVKDAFVVFGNKQIELIKGDKNAVDKVDNNIGDGSILDGLLGVQPEEDTSNGQERGEIYNGEISYSHTKAEDYERIHTNSGGSTPQELSFPSIFEQPGESPTNTEVLQEGCSVRQLLTLPDNVDGCKYECMLDYNNNEYWGEVCRSSP